MQQRDKPHTDYSRLSTVLVGHQTDGNIHNVHEQRKWQQGRRGRQRNNLLVLFRRENGVPRVFNVAHYQLGDLSRW